jgi:hypothetical protein
MGSLLNHDSRKRLRAMRRETMPQDDYEKRTSRERPTLEKRKGGAPAKNRKTHILSGKEFGGGNYGAEGT